MAPTIETPTEEVAARVHTSSKLLGKLNLEDNRAREHIFRSKLPDIKISNRMNLADFCLGRVKEYPNQVAMVNGVTGQKWTYRETQIIAKRVSAGLHKMGIAKGDVIALLLPNCAEFVLVMLGSMYRGSIISTCNPFYTEMEITKQLKACRAKLVVTQAPFVDKVRILGVPIITVDCLLDGTLPVSMLFENDESDAPVVQVDPEDVICLPYSSGTTGLPKGVMLTHKSLISGITQQVEGENPNMDLNVTDVNLCLLPMFHIYSLVSVILCSIRVCSTLVIMPKYTIPQLLELIQTYRVTYLPIVPPVVLGISKSPIVKNYNLSSVKLIMCGAAPLGKELEEAFQEKFPRAMLGQGYGMTEAGPVLSMSLNFAKHPFPVKSGSCGTVVRNAEVKIMDMETGASLPYNKPGEMCIRGPQIMKGYLDNHEATIQTIDKEGWLHTGDIAYIDEDEEVFLVDRVKEIIKYKGFQVPPAELEAILVAHPSILDAAVVGKGDEVAGEVPVAFIVRNGGAAITAEAVQEFVSKQVVFYKRLESVFFIDSIPKSPAGKILRKDLRSKLP